MNADAALLIRFWGVRGSIATPGSTTVRYGGNTSCVEVRAADRLIILDGGTGLRALGDLLMAQEGPVEGDIFFSHMHWDHIQGVPFFAPAFVPGNTFRLWAVKKDGDARLRPVLERQMTDPNFPVPLSVMQSNISFNEIDPGDTIKVGPVTVKTMPLAHPGGCIGLRIEHQGRVFVYATDHEHTLDGELHEPLVELSRDADILVYDGMYTEQEFLDGKIGWGHSTHEAGLCLARAANAKRLYFFHHNPTHCDQDLDERLSVARASVAGDGRLTVEIAKEGETVYL